MRYRFVCTRTPMLAIVSDIGPIWKRFGVCYVFFNMHMLGIHLHLCCASTPTPSLPAPSVWVYFRCLPRSPFYYAYVLRLVSIVATPSQRRRRQWQDCLADAFAALLSTIWMLECSPLDFGTFVSVSWIPWCFRFLHHCNVACFQSRCLHRGWCQSPRARSVLVLL